MGSVAGYSEHQLGIAVDINADTSKCSVMMFTTGYLKTLINMVLSKDIRQERQALRELLMNRGIIAM